MSVRTELVAVFREITVRIAPEARRNPMAMILLEQLGGYLQKMPESQAREIAEIMAVYGERLKRALDVANGLEADRPQR